MTLNGQSRDRTSTQGPGQPLSGGDEPARTESGHVHLVGRTNELAMLDRLIEQVRGGRAPSVLLHGAAGVGKTALLDAAAIRARADGFQVLRATGVESEVTLPLSGLHQLLYGLADEFRRLPDGQQAVLESALGLSQEAVPERFVLSSAVLTLLHSLASDRPVLLVVDDVQWIDRASARIIAFAVRRLAPKQSGFLGAVRTEWKTSIDMSPLLPYRVEPLQHPSAAELLDSRFPGLAETVRQRLLDEAAGNPLALLELPTLLSQEQLAGQAQLPSLLSLSDQLESLYIGRVRSLPEATRDLLLLAALETTGSIRAIWSAMPGGCPAADRAVVPAERAALVRTDAANDRLTFRHPLVRSAIVQLATPDRRRFAHRALGAALDHEPERQIGHLIAGCLGPDEDAAQMLESAAHRAAQRGAATVAVIALRHASGRSPKDEDRSRRLTMAALAASHAGQLDAAAEMLDSGNYNYSSPEDAARAASAAAFRLIHRDGDVRSAHRLLLRALDDVTGRGAAEVPGALAQELTDELFYLLIKASFYGGSRELWEEIADRISRASEFTKLSFDALADPVRRGHTVGRRLRLAFDGLTEATDPRRITQLACAALFCDDLSRYREQAARAAEQARSGGAFASWASATLLLALEAYHTGRWQEAEGLLREGLKVTDEFDYALLGCRMRHQLALIEAGRGHSEAVEALTDDIVAVSVPRGVQSGQMMLRQSRALLALADGDYETAYRHCARISPPGQFPAYVPWALWSVLDLVEAAVMTGRIQEARAHVAAAVQGDIGALSPRTALLVAGAAAVAATDEEAQKLFEEALTLPDADRHAFESARIRLAYGQWLLDQGHNAAAREQLGCAMGTLERLGAEPWAKRAREACRNTGLVVDARPEADEAALTPRELQIAKLAATGKSNKQIAAELFVSQRTVSTHLYNIFPKLGITSRAALRDALRAIGEHGS
ncbi:helix-turn-helix transcriptional regulator [Streptomyces sp. HC307]|uniref:helix-turn-helix transcriptional regulator n=1 Tax=Streptomyces flavusporus TaxID=3385496 RepID=UPI0039171C9B